jgi:hypothetical protein
MRLTELNPSWIGAGGEGVTCNGLPVPERHGIGLICDCPCGCGNTLYIPFKNPLDNGIQYGEGTSWDREGDNFENITLSPSIRRIAREGSCGWHGFIRKGNIETCSDSIPATPEFIERMKEFNRRNL